VKLHACIYCGSEAVAVEETDIGGYVVACGCCGLSGPEAPFAGVAVRRWEILCSHMCSHCRKNLIPIMPETPSFDNTMPAGHNCRDAGENQIEKEDRL